jgi:serine/threonine-protein kinase
MSVRHHRCDPGRIEQLLDGRLTPDEQGQFEKHIEVCSTCRERLESTAAEQAYWNDAAVHLRDDALDSEVGACSSGSAADLEGASSSDSATALRVADYFDPTDDPRMLGRFGGYEIAGIVGFGGMGVVLKGFEPALDRYVAIKLLAPHLATSGAARTRFAREARAAAAVLHENVVAIHRVAEANALPYLVMPYMPGDSLQKRLDDCGPMQLAEILRIGMQIAAGLAAAHAQGLIHRDIKPGNILLDKGVERVTITDFGLARAADDASLTRSGVIAGTPQYMSPEQARGQPLDCRSDLFSLGSLLYVLCTGRPPFRAETAFGVLHRISESQPTPIRQIAPETPDWLCEIIAKLHAKDPHDRFQSAGEVAALLGRWLAHLQQPTVIPAPPRTRKREQRTAWTWRIVAAAAIVLMGIGGVATYRLLSPVEGGNMESGGDQALVASGAEVHSNRSHTFAATAAISDDRALQEDYGAVRQHIIRVERQWDAVSSPADDAGWAAETSELHRRLDDLSQRIDQNGP